MENKLKTIKIIYFLYNLNMINKLKNELEKLKDDKYQKFQSKLIPNATNIIGVRIPQLRKIAKNIHKSSNNEEINSIINFREENEPLELKLIQGFLIGLKKSDEKEFFKDIEKFIPQIDNWAVCDCLCASLKQTKKYKNEMYDFLKKYLASSKEYEIRFGVVMLLNYYIDDTHIERTLRDLSILKSNDYYAQMGIAWALSICYVKYYDKTHNFILNTNIDKTILALTIKKVCESLRPTEKEKQELKEYKKQKGL